MKIPSAVWGYAALGAVVIVAYKVISSDVKKAAGVVGKEVNETVTKRLNPGSTENYLNRVVNGFIDIVDDGVQNSSATLGTKVADWTGV